MFSDLYKITQVHSFEPSKWREESRCSYTDTCGASEVLTVSRNPRALTCSVLSVARTLPTD